MSRSIIIAILAFGLLIVANMAVFGFLGFRTLSERMVTERLVEGLNEATRLARHHALDDGREVSRRLAPELRSFDFLRSVVVFDRNGRVVHREIIGGQLIRPSLQGAYQPSQPNPDSTWRIVPVQSPVVLAQNGQRLALEYDEEAIGAEVEKLRGEFTHKMWWAIGFSLVLLSAGLAYVLFAYRRNQKLQEQARRADRMAYVGTLSSGLAHEIRNPLNSMNMNVQLIEEELDDVGIDADTEIREMLEGTRREVARLERLVSSFLAYARPTDLEKKLISVNDLVGDLLEFLAPEIKEKGIVLEQRFAENLPALMLDPNQMKQALLNVVQNAISVLEHGQKLVVETRRAGGDNLLITVRDEGPGISAEELKNIFKEFYSTRLGGTGLGLPIAQRIAELHRGGIKVESEVGKGTTFTFVLPIEGESR